MLNLTIAQACATTNIWFKVETEEQQRRFQEEFFKQGAWVAGDTEIRLYPVAMIYYLTSLGLACVEASSGFNPTNTEQVSIIWQEEPFIDIASLAPETTLSFSLNKSKSWQNMLSLLTSLKNEELVQSTITDRCLRRLGDSQLAALAKFLIEKRSLRDRTQEVIEQEDVVKSFVLTTKNHLTKKTKQTEYWYKFYRKEVENVVRQCQAGLYQEELKKRPEWESLSWERRS